MGEVTVEPVGPTVNGDVLLELGVRGNREVQTGRDDLVGGEVTEDNRLDSRTDRRHRGVLENRVTEEGVLDRKSTRLNSSHIQKSRMPSSA